MIAIAALLVIAVPAAAQAQYVPSPVLSISLSTTVAAAGDTITVETSGWQPGSEVQISIDGRVLATAIADDTGTVVVEVTLPADLAPGEYAIMASGIDAEGNPGSVSALLTIVDDAAVVVPPGTRTPPPAATGILPLTGSSASQLVLAGMALLVAGLGAAFVARRRLNPAV